MLDKEHDFKFCCPQICVQRLFMDRDQILPDWTDLLQLLLKYFLDTTLNSGRGKGFFFFFWSMTGSMLPSGLSRCAELTQWPNKVRRATKPPQRPIKAPSCSFFTSFLIFHWFPTSKKFSGAVSSLAGPSFQLQSCCFSLFYIWDQCLFFLLLSSFLQDVSSNTTRDAC